MNQISSFHKGISSSIVAFVMSETMVVFDNWYYIRHYEKKIHYTHVAENPLQSRTHTNLSIPGQPACYFRTIFIHTIELVMVIYTSI
jgi:hypothetical protein